MRPLLNSKAPHATTSAALPRKRSCAIPASKSSGTVPVAAAAQLPQHFMVWAMGLYAAFEILSAVAPAAKRGARRPANGRGDSPPPRCELDAEPATTRLQLHALA